MKSLTDIAMLLGRAGVEYALIGGHAVNLVLEPRFTADVDITINADVDAIERLNAELLAAGFRHREWSKGPDRPARPRPPPKRRLGLRRPPGERLGC